MSEGVHLGNRHMPQPVSDCSENVEKGDTALIYTQGAR